MTFLSCKNTFCPSFPENIDNYFPYLKGEVIKFSNQNNDTLCITVVKNWVSDSYSYKWNCKCSCEATAGFNTDLENVHLLRIEGRITIYNEENRSELTTEIYNAHINSDTFTIILENTNPYSSENNSIFGDTIRIEKEEFNRINTILIVKGKGIVEFYDKNQNCTWIKIQ
jgi:hypothetical protein